MNLKDLLNHDRYKLLLPLVAALILAIIFGCRSTVESLLDPTRQVDRARLRIELDGLLAQYEARLTDLDQQDSFKKAILDHAALFAETGGLNPTGIILSLGTLFGVGALTDNVRYRKQNPKPPPAGGTST